MLAQLDDTALILHNREASIPLLLKRHAAIIHHMAYRVTGFQIIPYEDRVQAASIGFMEAIRTFDPTRGAKLTTYAYWKIREELLKLKLSYYSYADGRELEYEYNFLSLANEADYEKAELPEGFEYQLSMTAEELLKDVDNPFENLNPLDTISQSDIEQLIQNNTGGLRERELEIFYHIHGLFGYEEYTQQEIADMMHISRQRVQQIANSVFNCIKHRIVQKEDAKDYLS